MGNYKASGIVAIRNFLQKKGTITENQFISLLTPEERQYYQTVTTDQWLPIETLIPKENLMSKAANFIFPDEADPIVSLGQLIAALHFTGIYRFLIRIPNPHSILKHYPKILHNFHDQGTAENIQTSATSATLIIRDHPTLPEVIRHYLVGFLTRMLIFAGAKTPKIVHDDQDYNAWKWHFEWEK